MPKFLLQGRAKPQNMPVSAIVEASDKEMAKAMAARALIERVYFSHTEPIKKFTGVKISKLHRHARDVGILG